MVSEYAKKLKDPRWQKKRLKILERDEWTCQACFQNESTLVVHHRVYLANTEPWDYPDDLLVTLCENCHEAERNDRPGYEIDLLNILRDYFFTEDIHSLATGFYMMKPLHSHEVVASVYEWALASPQIQMELTNRYFLELKTKSGAEKKGNHAKR